jgi:hypothetical protein
MNNPTITTGTVAFPAAGDTFHIAKGIDVEFGREVTVEIHDENGVVFVASGANVILTGTKSNYLYKVTEAK